MPPSETPLVSIIIPTCDRPALLQRALASARAQTWTPAQIIVVDDGSRPPLESSCTQNIANAHLLAHSERRGPAAARNTGIRAANGVFIAFLDDDDQWAAEKLTLQMECFANAPAPVGLVYCGYRLIAERSGEVASTYRPRAPAVTFLDFLTGTVFGSSVPLIRRECFDTVGLFDETIPATHDRDMWLRIAKRYQLAFVPQVLSDQHIHGAQITTNIDLKIAGRTKILEKHYADLAEHPALLAHQLTRLGMLCFAGAQPARGRQHLRAAIHAGASRRSLYPHLVFSILVPAAHRRYVERHAFRRVDEFSLYY